MDTFSSFRGHDFRFLLSGTMAASFAMWMEQIGQGWLVAQLTNSAFQLGLIQFIRGITYVMFSLFAGWFSDHIDRRVLAGVASMVNGLSALAIALLLVFYRVEMWEIYLVSAIGGLAGSIYNPVRQYLVYDSVPNDQLSNAIALNSMANNAARVVGPGLAGFIIGFSISAAFLGETIFFTVATLSLIPMRLTQQTAPPMSESMVASTRAAASYLFRHRVLLRLTILQLIPTVLIFPYVQLMPLMAKNYLHVGAQGYGWLQTGVGIGSVISAFLVAYFSETPKKGTIASISLSIYMTMILAFSFSRIYALSLFLLILGGMGLVVFSSFNQTLVQIHVDDEYRGRVLAFYSLVMGMNSFGSLAMGIFASKLIGTPYTIASFSIAALVLALMSGIASEDIRKI